MTTTTNLAPNATAAEIVASFDDDLLMSAYAKCCGRGRMLRDSEGFLREQTEAERVWNAAVRAEVRRRGI